MTTPSEEQDITAKFLACPFCDSSDLFRTYDNINHTDRVNCRGCKANAVLWKWNTRASTIKPSEPAMRMAAADPLRSMLKLLDDPHPGLSTWCEAIVRARKEVLEYLDADPR